MILLRFSEGDESTSPSGYKWSREVCDPVSYITCLREISTVKSLHSVE